MTPISVDYLDGSQIQTSYARVTIQGVTGGGFLGFGANSPSVSQSYSIGPVQANSSAEGAGFIFGGTCATSECFYDATITNNVDVDGGAYSMTTAEMKNVKIYTRVPGETGIGTAWDFTDNPFEDVANSEIWEIDASGTINDGYPHLAYENIALSVAP